MFKNIHDRLLLNLESGLATAIITTMSPRGDLSGDILDKSIVTASELDSNIIPSKLSFLSAKIEDTFNSGLPTSTRIDGQLFIIEPYFPKPRMIIFGGGHIAKPLSELGAQSEFEVTVVDDRPMFANSARFPSASKVICNSFEESFKELDLRSSDFVVIVTRGHAHDGICLRKSLEYNLAYLGMIGSRRRVKGMMDMLVSEGYSEEKLSGISSPIGLDIGAVTPFEVAVSIVGEIIQHRRLKNGGRDSKNNKKFNWPEFDRDVLEELRLSGQDRALVTIISSKGSVPRKAGAKMIVYPDGRLLGSIGGGCSEAGIISKARDLIREGGYSIESVDMTGQVAEDLGMVCGGTMEVLIESL